MKQMLKGANNLLNLAIVLALTAMCILVFINAVMRYTLDSGIDWSEEVSRFLLIWMTFLGAIAALKDNQHLGVDMFVKRLPMNLRKVVFVISNLLVLYCLWLVLQGSWTITVLNLENKATSSGIKLFWVYGVGLVTCLGMGGILLYNIFHVLFQNLKEEDLVMTMDSEELMKPAVNK